MKRLPPNDTTKTITKRRQGRQPASFEDILAGIETMDTDSLKMIIELSTSIYQQQTQGVGDLLPSDIWSQIFLHINSTANTGLPPAGVLYQTIKTLFSIQAVSTAWREISQATLTQLQANYANDISLLKKTLHFSCAVGDVRLFNYLFDEWNIKKWNYGSLPLVISASFGNTSLTQAIMTRKLKEFDIREENFYVFRICAEIGNDTLVKELLRSTKLSPNAVNNYAIKHSSACGFHKITHLLLNDGRVQANASRDKPLRYAVQNGHLRVVELLLANEHVSPETNDDFAIQAASQNGHTEIVKLLLSHPHVSPQANDNAAIRLASQNGHTLAIQALLADPRVSPDACNNQALQRAAQMGHLNAVKTLLQDPRVSPDADDNRAIRGAAHMGHIEVVRALLSDPRVSPEAKQNAALISSVKNRHYQVTALLLTDQRVKLWMERNLSTFRPPVPCFTE